MSSLQKIHVLTKPGLKMVIPSPLCRFLAFRISILFFSSFFYSFNSAYQQFSQCLLCNNHKISVAYNYRHLFLVHALVGCLGWFALRWGGSVYPGYEFLFVLVTHLIGQSKAHGSSKVEEPGSLLLPPRGHSKGFECIIGGNWEAMKSCRHGQNLLLFLLSHLFSDLPFRVW